MTILEYGIKQMDLFPRESLEDLLWVESMNYMQFRKKREIQKKSKKSKKYIKTRE